MGWVMGAVALLGVAGIVGQILMFVAANDPNPSNQRLGRKGFLLRTTCGALMLAIIAVAVALGGFN